MPDNLLLFDDQLSEEERLISNNTSEYCQDKLFPRILEANRSESFDRDIYYEMGELGILGATLKGYGCAGVNYVSCLLYTSPSPRDATLSRMPSSA